MEDCGRVRITAIRPPEALGIALTMVSDRRQPLFDLAQVFRAVCLLRVRSATSWIEPRLRSSCKGWVDWVESRC
jgi:hypothetical protein